MLLIQGAHDTQFYAAGPLYEYREPLKQGTCQKHNKLLLFIIK